MDDDFLDENDSGWELEGDFDDEGNSFDEDECFLIDDCLEEVCESVLDEENEEIQKECSESDMNFVDVSGLSFVVGSMIAGNAYHDAMLKKSRHKLKK